MRPANGRSCGVEAEGKRGDKSFDSPFTSADRACGVGTGVGSDTVRVEGSVLVVGKRRFGPRALPLVMCTRCPSVDPLDGFGLSVFDSLDGTGSSFFVITDAATKGEGPRDINPAKAGLNRSASLPLPTDSLLRPPFVAKGCFSGGIAFDVASRIAEPWPLGLLPLSPLLKVLSDLVKEFFFRIASGVGGSGGFPTLFPLVFRTVVEGAPAFISCFFFRILSFSSSTRSVF